MRACFIALIALGALAQAAIAQQPGEATVTALRVEGASLDASVAVLDAGGNPVTNLTAGNFRAQLDGRDIALTRVESGVDTALPIGLVLAVDTSGSMSGEAIAAARSALAPLVTSLLPGDEATLIAFAQQVRIVVPRTSDRAALEAAVQKLQAAGNTALFAGAATAAAATAEHPQPRKTVVLLSDGEDFGNASAGVTRDQAVQAARAANAPFFVVGLGKEVDQQFLTSLARDTGGQYFAAATPAELAQLYARISERLRRQYTLTIQLPADLPPGDHRVAFVTGGVTATSSFTTTSTAAPRVASLAGLPSEVVVPVTVHVQDVPAGGSLRFEVDGAAAQALTDGRSLRLDPYAFAPGKHEIVVRSSEGAVLVQSAFQVPPLLPRLLEPFELPNLAPGDLVRLALQAQPGTTSVAYRLDGREIERDEAPPYEVVVPRDIGDGDHELSFVAANANGEFAHAYAFATGSSSSNAPVYIALAAAGVAVAGGAAFAGRRAVARFRNRAPSPAAPTDVGELTAWVQTNRTLAAAPEAGAPAAAPGAPWGRLTVLEGPDKGKSFELNEDTELVGRGKFCTVRLSDKSLQDAHFVLTRDGRLAASTAKARVERAGAPVRTATLEATTEVRAGATVLRIELGRNEAALPTVLHARDSAFEGSCRS